MTTRSLGRLPRVIVSSVIRSSRQGESHGGLYLADLETGATERVLDWNDPSINWEGRGADRGLRGIAFHGGLVHAAASDEIFVFDPDFRRVASFRNPYLKHCHEIFIEGDLLFATSTGFDSVLVYDLAKRSWIRGYLLRVGGLGKRLRRLHFPSRPGFLVFDPAGDDGPAPGDSTHLNSAFVHGGVAYVCGTGTRAVWAIEEGATGPPRLSRYATVPYGSHNARPWRDGVLLNHTQTDQVAHVDRRGRLLQSFPLVHYPERDLLHASLAEEIARQAFGRGLAVIDEELFVSGSSPATVTVYRFGQREPVKSINLTMDVRNSVHGLEVWPYEREPRPAKIGGPRAGSEADPGNGLTGERGAAST